MRQALHIVRLLLVIGLMSLAAMNLAVALNGIATIDNYINLFIWILLVIAIVIWDGGIIKKYGKGKYGDGRN